MQYAADAAAAFVAAARSGYRGGAVVNVPDLKPRLGRSSS